MHSSWIILVRGGSWTTIADKDPVVDVPQFGQVV
jgi:hypothetical protein